MSHPSPWRDRPLGLILCHAFLAAILMWCAWTLTHLPGLDFPPALRAILMLASLAGVAAMAGRACPFPTSPARVGAIIGLGTGLLTLLVLGSELVEQPSHTADVAPGASGLRPSALVFVPGFLALMAAIGACGSIAGRRVLRPTPRSRDFFATFALVSCLAFVPLLLVGGLVTTTNAGMAVPDWPNSYGANMFLYPVAMMAAPDIFLEHTHRLFGSLIGLTTLCLACMAMFRPVGVRARTLAGILFALVVAQGVLGGTRVLEDSRFFGAIHGFLAMGIFALASAIAAWAAESNQGVPALARRERLRGLERLSTGLLHLTLLQTLLGSLYRHLRLDEAAAKGVGHVLYSHMGVSLAVVLLAAMVGFRAIAAGRGIGDLRGRLISMAGTSVVACVLFQFLLGWAVFGVLQGEGGATATLVRTLHHVNGAALLASAAVVSVWAKRIPASPRG